MAERRRIIPASVGPLFKPKEEKSWKPAVRFTLTLDEPNDTKCTEYSYRELYKNAVVSYSYRCEISGKIPTSLKQCLFYIFINFSCRILSFFLL